LEFLLNGIAHRGPDEKGVFFFKHAALGMRRLSIIDLEGGNQPISNESGNLQLVLNGEIYNYLELRKKLIDKGHVFKTNSDTEVIVHLYEEHGLDFLSKLQGMFCFALFDSDNEKLIIAKDRLGKKPLFYNYHHGQLTFCSELDPLSKLDGMTRTISPDALSLYLANGFIPSPKTIYKDFEKLPPAHYLIWEKGFISIHKYWELKHEPNESRNPNEWLEEFEQLFNESVRIRLRSDVPIGLLLSGGLDSNAVMTMIGRLGKNAEAFTVGFGDQKYDESELAESSAKQIGFKHRVLPGSSKLLDYVPRIVRHYGEPFADKSALPSFYLCEQVSNHVKVALNGDGGDELLAGYPRYRKKAPLDLFYALPIELRERWCLKSFLGQGFLGSRPVRNLRRKFLPDTECLFTSEFFTGLPFQRVATNELRLEAQMSWPEYMNGFWARANDPLNRMLSWDYDHYLSENLLVKMDIAGMAHGLEVRSPFLDHELVELCAEMPPEIKISRHEGKLPLRNFLELNNLERLLNSPKKGFSVPLGGWWKNESKDIICESINEIHESLSGFIRKDYLKRIFFEHQLDQKDHAQRLYSFYVLNSWATDNL